MIKNKKGDFGDFVLLITIVFSLGITFVMGSMIWNNVVTPLQDKANEHINDTIIEDKLNSSFQNIDNTFASLDWIFAIFFFGFYLVLLISVFYLDSAPAFMVFALIGLFIVFILGGVMSDAWNSFMSESSRELTDGGYESADNYPIMNHIMSNLLTYLIIMSSIFLIILYASKQVGG